MLAKGAACETAGNVASVSKPSGKEDPDKANPIPTKDAGIGEEPRRRQTCIGKRIGVWEPMYTNMEGGTGRQSKFIYETDLMRSQVK